jgi:hypothetical protein
MMAYFKIGENDYSAYCNALKVNSKVAYSAQTNAAGNSVVDYINTKHTVEVGIIPLNDAAMLNLQNDIAQFQVDITYRNPATNDIKTIKCIIPDNGVEYYTIQTGKVMYKAFKLTFNEL